MRTIPISLNTGVLNTVSAAQDVSDLFGLAVNVVQASGSIAGAVTTVEQSVDGSTWVSTGITIAAAALSANVTVYARWFRLKVTTASGTASTATCTVQGKESYSPAILNAAAAQGAKFDALLTGLEAILASQTTMNSFLYSLDKAQRRPNG